MQVSTDPYLYGILYSPPNGTKSLVKLTGASAEDVEWFKENRIILSVEFVRSRLNSEYVLYGKWPGQDDEDEVLAFSISLTRSEMFKELRKQLENTKP